MKIKIEIEATAESVRSIVFVDGKKVSCRDMLRTDIGFQGDRPGDLDDDLADLDDEDLVQAIEDTISNGTEICRVLERY